MLQLQLHLRVVSGENKCLCLNLNPMNQNENTFLVAKNSCMKKTTINPKAKNVQMNR